MELVETITTFLLGFYSRPPLKTWFICMIIGLVLERIFYAEKGQPLKNILFTENCYNFFLGDFKHTQTVKKNGQRVLTNTGGR